MKDAAQILLLAALFAIAAGVCWLIDTWQAWRRWPRKPKDRS